MSYIREYNYLDKQWKLTYYISEYIPKASSLRSGKNNVMPEYFGIVPQCEYRIVDYSHHRSLQQYVVGNEVENILRYA